MAKHSVAENVPAVGSRESAGLPQPNHANTGRRNLRRLFRFSYENKARTDSFSRKLESSIKFGRRAASELDTNEGAIRNRLGGTGWKRMHAAVHLGPDRG